MQVALAPLWELTTEHACASDRHPVLVNRSTWEAFGPGDLVEV